MGTDDEVGARQPVSTVNRELSMAVVLRTGAIPPNIEVLCNVYHIQVRRKDEAKENCKRAARKESMLLIYYFCYSAGFRTSKKEKN